MPILFVEQMDGISDRDTKLNPNKTIRKDINQSDSNPQPNQHARIIINIQPHDANLDLHPIMMRLCTTTLYVLMSERVYNTSLDMNYLNNQIIQTIVPSEINGTNTLFLHGNKSRNHNKNNQVIYSRLFLLVFSIQVENKIKCATQWKSGTQRICFGKEKLNLDKTDQSQSQI